MNADDTQQLPGPQTQELPRVVAMKQTRRVAVSIVGGTLVLAGIALIPLPGPFTIPLIFLGLTVLSWEFKWAKRMLFNLRSRIKRMRRRRGAV